MPAVDGVNLYYEETGPGAPLVFVHEFAGDSRSWHLQVRFFARRYRCIAFNARGYPPSDVPDDPAAYSQQRAVDDIKGVLDQLGIAKAHVCGLSMGGYATLHLRSPLSGASALADRRRLRLRQRGTDRAAFRGRRARRAALRDGGHGPRRRVLLAGADARAVQ